MSIPVTVVIPAYNEAATIRDLARRVLQHTSQLIVVDDGSSDGTADQLADLPLTLIRHQENRGKAASLHDGMQAAVNQGAKCVITLDGDGQHVPEDIPKLYASWEANPKHLIIGARLQNREQAPNARRRANNFADFWISWAAGCRIHDSQSGLRLYPADAIQSVFVSHSRERGFVFESEYLIEAAKKGFGFSTVPVESRYPQQARASHFRPVADITRIVLMVAGKLIANGMYPMGLYRVLFRENNEPDRFPHEK